MNLPPLVSTTLTRAGWKLGRRIESPRGLVEQCGPAHPAIEILSSFSGLHAGTTGRGIECAMSDVRFRWVNEGEYEELTRPWEALLRTRLIGVAEVHNDHGALFVAADGRCFHVTLIGDSVSFCGDDIGDALLREFEGRKVRPMLLPDEDSVMLYGIVYDRNSPELYRC